MKPFKILISAALIVPSVGILLVGPRGVKEEAPEGFVVVDYWEKWTGDEYKQLKQTVVDPFNETVGKEKHIYVRLLSTANITQKVLVSTAAGVPPDVAGLWDPQLSQLVALDAVEPLETMAAEHGIRAEDYKKVYWDAIHFEGHLNALISTPASIGLHYNKRLLSENAEALRKAGLDPTRPPETVEELDRYAAAMTVRDAQGQIEHAGFLPLVPDWYRANLFVWFGGETWDEVNHRFTLTDPNVVRAYEWVQSYSKRLGSTAVNTFTSGLGTFDSPQNPFLTGLVAMEQQGPWMANYIGHLKPSMSSVKGPLGSDIGQPPEVRHENYEWAVAPFPSAVPGQRDVAFCSFDSLVIPRGARHKREAFELIAYMQRQDVMERLCSIHCKNSPLSKVSPEFVRNHPNPYIDVFERLAASPNAHHIELTPVFAEYSAEMDAVIQRIALNEVGPRVALQEAQDRLQAKYDQFMERQRARRAGKVPQ